MTTESNQPSDPTQTMSSDGSGSGSTDSPPRRGNLGDTLTAGEQLGPYVVKGELGRGGMGIVYRGYDATLERDVAIKVMPPGVADDEVKRARFLREARSAAQLQHPAIVPVYMAGEQGQLVYLAMGYVRGQTLATRIRQPEGIPLGEALGIVRDVALALKHAHDKGLVHRDIKPENIMIDTAGEVKVMDFGLARSVIAPAEGHITDTGLYLGTPIYSSPEQVKAKPLDARSDLYSLGVVLYEMVTRQRPFEGASAYETFHAIMHAEVEPPHKLDQRLPESVSRLVGWMMARDPEQRPQNGESVAAMCDEVLSQLGEQTRGLILEQLPTTRSLAPASHAPTLGADPARQPSQPQTSPQATSGIATQQSNTRNVAENQQQQQLRGFAPPSLVATVLLGFLALGLVWFGTPPSTNGGEFAGAGGENVQPGSTEQERDNNTNGGGQNNGERETDPQPAAGNGDEDNNSNNNTTTTTDPSEAPAEPIVVLFEPFESAQTIESLEWLRVGIPSMLTSALAGTDGLRLVSHRHAAAEITRLGLTEEDEHTQILALAEAMNLDVIVRGNYYLFGESLRLDVMLIDPRTGMPRDRVSQTGREEEIFAMLDRTAELLYDKLLEHFWLEPDATVMRGNGEEGGTPPGEVVQHPEIDGNDAQQQRQRELEELRRRRARDSGTAMSQRQLTDEPMNAMHLRAILEDLHPTLEQHREEARGSDGTDDAESESGGAALASEADYVEQYVKSLLPGYAHDEEMFETLRLLIELRETRSRWQAEAEAWLDKPLGFEQFADEMARPRQLWPKGHGQAGEISGTIQRALDAAREQHSRAGAGADYDDEDDHDVDELTEQEHELQEQEEHRRALAVRHAMLGAHHYAAAQHHRDAGESEEMAEQVRLAVIHLLRSLIAEPRYRPAHELLQEIKQTDWQTP